MATDVLSSRHSTEDVEKALWTLALNAGSPTQASEALAQQGLHIPKQTLDRWKKHQYAQRYQEICNQASAEIANRVATEAEQFMLAAAQTERLALRKLHEQLEQGEIKDISSALRNITTSKALNNDKIASPLRGRPTNVTEHRTIEQALKQLGNLIDSTATDITDTPQAEAHTAQIAASS